jgi:FkbM family methyltransferase
VLTNGDALSDMLRHMSWRQRAKRLLRRANLRVVHEYDADLDAQRQLLIERYHVATVLDVGANEGQYGLTIRQESAYQGQIVSFEPGREAFTALAARSAADPRWVAYNYGLSDKSTTGTLFVPENASTLASLNPMTGKGQAWSAAFTASSTAEVVELRRLDEILDDVAERSDPIFLKLDVQGHEGAVLAGASAALDRLTVIECELALTPMYDQQPAVTEMLTLFNEYRFRPVGIYTHFIDPATGEAFDADVLLVRG